MIHAHHPIWGFHRKLARRLLLWSGLSIIAGLLILLSPEPFWRGFASQYIGWGVIDAIIAVVGRLATKKKHKALAPEALDAASLKEAASLRRILAINTGLDVLYVLGGLAVIYFMTEPVWRGVGWGIVVQGGFLFVFDLVHTFLCPKQ